jgi:SNF2 family DNA or RNA helicase
MLSQKKFFPPLLEVEWKLIIIDEFHEYKNSKSATYKSLEELRNSSACPLIGMTGTLMSNAHRELYTLIDLVQLGLLGTWKEFQREYSRPIMLAR